MIELGGGEITRDGLAGLCYRLRSEAASRGGNAVYDFVANRGVPCSFALEHELEKLEAQGLIGLRGSSFILRTEGPAAGIESSVEADIVRLIKGETKQMPVLNSVVAAAPAVYTAGYEGLSIDRFLSLLVESGIQRLIDVRNNPSSRRFGFHRSTLNRLTAALGIAYEHFPELGIPSRVRDLYSEEMGGRDLMFERYYEGVTLKSEAAAIERVATYVRERPSVLVCMEADPCDCHRSRLAVPVSRLIGLPVVHLRAGQIS